MTTKTFTVVGTAKNPTSGITKVRWGNDIVSRSKILYSVGKCEDINLHTMPHPMSKLESLDWLLKNTKLNEEQTETVYLKKAEKSRQHRASINVASVPGKTKISV